MAKNLLNTPVLLGTPLGHEEHKQMKVLLFILAIVLMMAATVLYSQSITPTNYVSPIMTQRPVVDQKTMMRNQAIAALRGLEPATPEQIKSAVGQLSNVKPMTEAVRASALKEAISQLKAK